MDWGGYVCDANNTLVGPYHIDFYEEMEHVTPGDTSTWYSEDENKLNYPAWPGRNYIYLHREVNFFAESATGDLEQLWGKNSIPGFFNTGPVSLTPPTWWVWGALENSAENSWTVSNHCCCPAFGPPSFYDTASGPPVDILNF